jgi:two-component system cell cycle sensor histidine kinase/response regulator CckA
MSARGLERRMLGIALTAACYVASAQLCFVLAAELRGFAPLWLQAGVALSALVLGGARLWPGVLLGALLAHAGRGLFAASLLAAGATLQALLAHELFVGRLHRLAFRGTKQELDVAALSVAALGSALVGAGAAHWALVSTRAAPGPFFRTWWLAEALGMLLVTPLAFARRARVHEGRARVHEGRRALRSLLAPSAATAALLVAAALAFSGRFIAVGFIYPALAWLALRGALRGALLALSVVTAVCLWTVHRGVPPFVHVEPAETALHVQVLLASMGWIALPLGVRGEREARQAQRTQALEREHQVLEACPVALAALDLERRVIGWNPAAERLFGFSREQVLGLGLPTLPADKEPELEALWAHAVREGAGASIDTVRRRSDGSLIEVSLSMAPLRDAEGRVVGMMAAFEDRTGSHKLEGARARLAAILEATTDFVSMADPNGVVTYLNRAGRALVGADEAEPLPRFTLADLVPEPVLGRLFEEVFPAAERRGAWSGQLALRHRDGSVIPVLMVVLAHRDSAGGIEYYSAIARDLRERLEAEAAIRKTEEQLRQAQKMEAIGRLAGAIAHDFNNLLTILLSAGELALAKLPSDHPARSDLLAIQKASERASALTRQLLAFSRRQVSEPENVDLNALVSGLEGMLRRVLGETIRIDVRLGPELGNVRAGKGQLEQVLMNLAVNARDAMPSGGLLTIETANVELGADADVTASDGVEPRAGAYVRLRVSDTGVGMESETQAHIFEPFFTTKEPDRGTGLGLATVYGIVKQSGGFITVRSEKHVGTTFDIYLPRVWEAGEPAAPQAEPSAPDGGAETILLVEDDPALRALARRVLKAHGYHVFSAADAESALALSAGYEGPIHLLLSDVVMPGKPGPALARELKRRRPELRVLFMSGYTESVMADQQLFGSHAHVLAKPFLPRTLLARVREVLDATDPAERQPRA